MTNNSVNVNVMSAFELRSMIDIHIISDHCYSPTHQPTKQSTQQPTNRPNQPIQQPTNPTTNPTCQPDSKFLISVLWSFAIDLLELDPTADPLHFFEGGARLQQSHPGTLSTGVRAHDDATLRGHHLVTSPGEPGGLVVGGPLGCCWLQWYG